MHFVHDSDGSPTVFTRCRPDVVVKYNIKSATLEYIEEKVKDGAVEKSVN